MRDAHKARGIGKKEFIKVADHVESTMKDLRVDENLITQVINLLGKLIDEFGNDDIDVGPNQPNEEVK